MTRERLHIHVRSRPVFLSLAPLLAIFVTAPSLFADEPYARSRDYDLQHSQIALRFNLEQKKVLGEVTHSLSVLREATAKIFFASSAPTIPKVTANSTAATSE